MSVESCTARKMAKGTGPECAIHNSIKYLFTIKKSSFIFIKIPKLPSEQQNKQKKGRTQEN